MPTSDNSQRFGPASSTNTMPSNTDPKHQDSIPNAPATPPQMPSDPVSQPSPTSSEEEYRDWQASRLAYKQRPPQNPSSPRKPESPPKLALPLKPVLTSKIPRPPQLPGSINTQADGRRDESFDIAKSAEFPNSTKLLNETKDGDHGRFTARSTKTTPTELRPATQGGVIGKDSFANEANPKEQRAANEESHSLEADVQKMSSYGTLRAPKITVQTDDSSSEEDALDEAGVLISHEPDKINAPIAKPSEVVGPQKQNSGSVSIAPNITLDEQASSEEFHSEHVDFSAANSVDHPINGIQKCEPSNSRQLTANAPGSPSMAPSAELSSWTSSSNDAMTAHNMIASNSASNPITNVFAHNPTISRRASLVIPDKLQKRLKDLEEAKFIPRKIGSPVEVMPEPLPKPISEVETIFSDAKPSATGNGLTPTEATTTDESEVTAAVPMDRDSSGSNSQTANSISTTSLPEAQRATNTPSQLSESMSKTPNVQKPANIEWQLDGRTPAPSLEFPSKTPKQWSPGALDASSSHPQKITAFGRPEIVAQTETPPSGNGTNKATTSSTDGLSAHLETPQPTQTLPATNLFAVSTARSNENQKAKATVDLTGKLSPQSAENPFAASIAKFWEDEKKKPPIDLFGNMNTQSTLSLPHYCGSPSVNATPAQPGPIPTDSKSSIATDTEPAPEATLSSTTPVENKDNASPTSSKQRTTITSQQLQWLRDMGLEGVQEIVRPELLDRIIFELSKPTEVTSPAGDPASDEGSDSSSETSPPPPAHRPDAGVTSTQAPESLKHSSEPPVSPQIRYSLPPGPGPPKDSTTVTTNPRHHTHYGASGQLEDIYRGFKWPINLCVVILSYCIGCFTYEMHTWGNMQTFAEGIVLLWYYLLLCAFLLAVVLVCTWLDLGIETAKGEGVWGKVGEFMDEYDIDEVRL